MQNAQNLLLGSSRIDLAALVIKVALGTITERRKDMATSTFLLPSSLEMVHTLGLETTSANERRFSIDTVYEFTNTEVFEGIQKSYCCGKIQIDSPQTFPIPVLQRNG